MDKRVRGFRDENIIGLTNAINLFIEKEGATLHTVEYQAYITQFGKEIFTAVVLYECP